ncbi:DMT family transporter [Pseudoalteromonas sp. MMG005]|uniref:DMT family transporter n=1 Tax=Pseudoalteromonas sp. MMG005 TaxID=2822682 RepID=UPI001B3A369B|nr:DMT family transporter [Pseudoalteromonas sp. MMG005]MBQ4844968.1 DMT family transporter [Pseudoalteromonas sp. MMG005]
MLSVGLGEIAAISAAMVWASSTVIYKRFSHSLSPLELNISKGVMACTMMCISLVLLQDSAIPSEINAWIWLVASGVIGIAVGDSAYFAALRNIGPARTLVIESMAPAITGILNILILGTYLNAMAWTGIIVTTMGVILAIKPRIKLPPLDKKKYKIGVCFALLAAACQAAGMVMSKAGMADEATSSLWAAMIRLFSGTMTVAMLVVFLKDHSINQAVKLSGISNKKWLIVAVFFGTFIGLWLQLGAVKYTDPAIAQTLLATAPLMVMTLALIKKEVITRNMIIGGVFAFFGVAVLLSA